MVDTTAVWLLIPCALSLFIYYPITGNYFFGDDLYNLYQIVNADLFTYLVTPGGHLLSTRNALFYLCYQLFGADPRGYFWLVLATHLVNVALLFAIIRSLTGSALLASFGAALWGASPAHEATLGWYSVYGQVVAAACVLWPLAEIGRLSDGRVLGHWAVIRWCLLLLAATTSFGVGMGVAIAFPLVVWLLHPPGRERRVRVWTLTAVAAAIPPLYFIILRLTLPIEHEVMITGFFSLGALAAWDQILLKVLQLAGYGTTCLLLGELYDPTGLASVRSSVALGLYLAVVLAAFAAGSALLRRRLLACAVMAFAAYGIIVAGRGFLGDNFYLATRYQYLTLVPVTLALCLALAELHRRWPVPRALAVALLLAWAAGAVGSRIWLGRKIDHHYAARHATMVALEGMRSAIASAPAGQPVYIPNQPFGGVGPLLVRNRRLFPGWAGAFVVFFPDNVVDGRRIFFVEPDADVVAATQAGKRTATLIVPPSP
jgi:hypothetical protein